jgi:hypothetical protein
MNIADPLADGPPPPGRLYEELNVGQEEFVGPAEDLPAGPDDGPEALVPVSVYAYRAGHGYTSAVSRARL